MGGDPARLRVTDHAVDAAADLEADPRNLRALAAARGAAHDDDRRADDGRGDLCTPRMQRQALVVA